MENLQDSFHSIFIYNFHVSVEIEDIFELAFRYTKGGDTEDAFSD